MPQSILQKKKEKKKEPTSFSGQRKGMWSSQSPDLIPTEQLFRFSNTRVKKAGGGWSKVLQ